jgi:hypothetical protein
LTRFTKGSVCRAHPLLRGKRYRSVEGYPGSCVACKKESDARRDHQPQGLRRYGLSVDQFRALLRSQRSRCAICRTTKPGKRTWHVDHDHASGRVRGLLCCNCNVMLGQGKDDPRRLEAGAKYLRRFR